MRGSFDAIVANPSFSTYQNRTEETRCSRRVEMAAIDLQEVYAERVSLEQCIRDARNKHNSYLKELGLPALP